tara:strand:+ start:176 stop:319 length:144 start_codon:yes stop_codon:yes gene_type:complete
MRNKYRWDKGDCPVTEGKGDRLARLPFYNNLLPDIDFSINNITPYKV